LDEHREYDVSFGSDNHSGVHPAVLGAIAAVNHGHVPAYGGDSVTAQAEDLIRREFGASVESFFVFTGTAANTLAIRALCQPYESVLATHCAHIQEDECGAPEYVTGSKILTVPAKEGKLTVEAIERLIIDPNFPHRSLPRLVSLTQATEVGTVYSVDEVRALVEAAHKRSLLVHMDGARLANAAYYLGTSLGELSTALGVDALSLGGTKNGLLCAEALIFRRADLAPRFAFVRKQSMQLASKMRYLACQFLPYLGDGLWRENARQANQMAIYLTRRLKETVPGVICPYPTQANEVFAHIPDPRMRQRIMTRAKAYPWDGDLVRFVCSFNTTEYHVDQLVALT
jgi:threonine aldolase